MKLRRALAETLVYAVNGMWIEGLQKVTDIAGDSGRWMQRHQLIVLDRDGKLWAADYEEGLTEYQQEPYWYGQTEVDFYQVKPVVVEVTEYEKL